METLLERPVTTERTSTTASIAPPSADYSSLKMPAVQQDQSEANRGTPSEIVNFYLAPTGPVRDAYEILSYGLRCGAGIAAAAATVVGVGTSGLALAGAAAAGLASYALIYSTTESIGRLMWNS